MDLKVIKILVAIVYGIFLGIITIPLSQRLISSRAENPESKAVLNKLWIRIAVVVAGVGSSTAIMLCSDTTALAVRNLLLLLPIFSIACVDAVVRKIPNPLLLIMLVIQAVYVVYHCISEKNADIISSVFVGLLVSVIVCTIPSFLKIPMGAGDIKYCAIIGMTIFVFDFFQAMVLMALFVAVYYIYLKIRKKGDIKTQIPMGPFFSIGTVISMCFSIFDVLG